MQYDVVQIGTDCGELVTPKDVQMASQTGLKWLVVDDERSLSQYRDKTGSIASTLAVDLDDSDELSQLLPDADLYVVRLAILRRKDVTAAKQLLLAVQRRAQSLRIRLLNVKEQPQLTERGLRLAWCTWPELTSPLTCMEVLGMLTDNQKILRQDGEIVASVQSGALLRHFRSMQIVSVDDPPGTRCSTRAQTLLPEREGQLKIPIPLTYHLEASV